VAGQGFEPWKASADGFTVRSLRLRASGNTQESRLRSAITAGAHVNDRGQVGVFGPSSHAVARVLRLLFCLQLPGQMQQDSAAQDPVADSRRCTKR
jgi:hypothetical protein